MIKYIEELNIGDCFTTSDGGYILTTDFKSNGYRLAISLKTGQSKWISGDTIVTIIDIFTLDKDNNIVAFKERKKEDVSN